MNEQLMLIAIQTIEFYANSDDDLVDPDTAVTKLEEIAYLLQQLAPNEREKFITFIKKLANSASDTDQGDFYLSIPKHLGLEA